VAPVVSECGCLDQTGWDPSGNRCYYFQRPCEHLEVDIGRFGCGYFAIGLNCGARSSADIKSGGTVFVDGRFTYVRTFESLWQQPEHLDAAEVGRVDEI